MEFPIFDAKSRSLKKAFLGKAGGTIGRNESNVVVIEALRDITMSLKMGDRVGLVGHNGAGKSTLLRLLSGIYEPTRGSATVTGRVAPVFDLGVGMDPEISGFENIIIRGLFLGQTRKQMMAKVDEIADFTELGEYLSMPLRTYSTGMRVRLAMGVVTSIDPEILLLDEGIGAVDAEFMKKARTRLQDLVARSGILVFASHSNEFLAQLCDTAMWVDHGTIKMTGGIEEVVRAYEGEDAARHVREVIEENAALGLAAVADATCIAVVVTHRRVEALARSLEAVTTQTRAPDHLVVVDNDDDPTVRELVAGQPVPTTYLGSAPKPRRRRRFRARHAARAGARRGLGVAGRRRRPPRRRLGARHTAGLRGTALAWPRCRRWCATWTIPTRLAFPLRRGVAWRRHVAELRVDGTGDLLPGIASLFNGALFRADDAGSRWRTGHPVVHPRRRGGRAPPTGAVGPAVRHVPERGVPAPAGLRRVQADPGRPDAHPVSRRCHQAVLHLSQPRLPPVPARPAQAGAPGVDPLRLVLPGHPPRPRRAGRVDPAAAVG